MSNDVIEDTPPAIQRLAEMVDAALVGVSCGEVFPTDRLMDMLLDMRAAVAQTEDTMDTMARMLVRALRRIPGTEYSVTFGAEHTLLVRTPMHDLLLRCVGRDEWVIVRLGENDESAMVEPVTFTREWVRTYLERLVAEAG